MKGVAGGSLDEAVEARLEADVLGALRRRPASEACLAGCLRRLAPLSPRLQGVLERALEVLVKRGSWGRALYTSPVRGLAEIEGERASAALGEALAADEAGGLASLSAACFTHDPALMQPLARVAISRHPQLAFAAEVARIARGESGGDHITSVAPKIKESHRIALCVELFVPLLRRQAMPIAIAPALSVLRGSERHLGRWLVFAEIGARAGDPQPLEEARERAAEGPSSARGAWSLVAWALADGVAPPRVRPTVELMARLSDRPSAERDSTFLFRLAQAGAASARPLLEVLAKGSDATGIRSALYLVKDHGRAELRTQLLQAASSARREQLRGVATAALFDAGEDDAAVAAATKLLRSKQVSSVAWAALVLAAAAGRLGSGPGGAKGLVTEENFRHIQLGWVE